MGLFPENRNRKLLAAISGEAMRETHGRYRQEGITQTLLAMFESCCHRKVNGTCPAIAASTSKKLESQTPRLQLLHCSHPFSAVSYVLLDQSSFRREWTLMPRGCLTFGPSSHDQDGSRRERNSVEINKITASFFTCSRLKVILLYNAGWLALTM